MQKDDTIIPGVAAETPETMEKIAEMIMGEIKGKGFMLLVYPLDGGPNNYISNSPPEKTWSILQAVARGIQTASSAKAELIDN